MNVPKIGDKGCYRVGSDVYPVTVDEVSASGKTVKVRSVKFVAGPGHDYYGEQVWEFIDTGIGRIETFRWSRKYGCFKNESCRLSLGEWRARQDPSF